MKALEGNYRSVQQRIAAAARRSGRAPEHVQLLAVVKQKPDAAVDALLELGQRDLAENRVQSLAQRSAELRSAARFHLIGHLQSNKAKTALSSFVSFHGLDSLRLAERLNSLALELQKSWPVYLQINISEEPQKNGFSIADSEHQIRAVTNLSGLQIMGLMGMAPRVESDEQTRPYFRKLRELRDAWLRSNVLPPAATGLSMGMSSDFEIAIEEGATVVRVGSALFAETLDSPEPQDF